jgi:TDG/mug DNA glycosylase family protein
MASEPWRPTREQLQGARGRRIPDVLRGGLQVVFVGINPGLYSAAVGHHFARPGNRFWKALHGAGFTERVLSPFEDASLLERGLGLTNLVERATASARELSGQELRTGAKRLRRTVIRSRPRFVAVLGIGAYREGFNRRSATFGQQDDALGSSGLWVLPNPSGLNAHFQLPDLVAAFGDLRDAVGPSPG